MNIKNIVKIPTIFTLMSGVNGSIIKELTLTEFINSKYLNNRSELEKVLNSPENSFTILPQIVVFKGDPLLSYLHNRRLEKSFHDTNKFYVFDCVNKDTSYFIFNSLKNISNFYNISYHGLLNAVKQGKPIQGLFIGMFLPANQTTTIDELVYQRNEWFYSLIHPTVRELIPFNKFAQVLFNLEDFLSEFTEFGFDSQSLSSIFLSYIPKADYLRYYYWPLTYEEGLERLHFYKDFIVNKRLTPQEISMIQEAEANTVIKLSTLAVFKGRDFNEFLAENALKKRLKSNISFFLFKIGDLQAGPTVIRGFSKLKAFLGGIRGSKLKYHIVNVLPVNGYFIFLEKPFGLVSNNTIIDHMVIQKNEILYTSSKELMEVLNLKKNYIFLFDLIDYEKQIEPYIQLDAKSSTSLLSLSDKSIPLGEFISVQRQMFTEFVLEDSASKEINSLDIYYAKLAREQIVGYCIPAAKPDKTSYWPEHLQLISFADAIRSLGGLENKKNYLEDFPLFSDPKFLLGVHPDLAYINVIDTNNLIVVVPQQDTKYECTKLLEILYTLALEVEGAYFLLPVLKKSVRSLGVGENIIFPTEFLLPTELYIYNYFSEKINEHLYKLKGSTPESFIQRQLTYLLPDSISALSGEEKARYFLTDQIAFRRLGDLVYNSLNELSRKHITALIFLCEKTIKDSNNF